VFKPEIDWLKKWAHYTPTKLFLREHDRNLEWSYANFNQRAESLAQHLKVEFGLRKGTRLAVYSKNRAEYVLVLFACWKLGAILVPLNFRLTPRELDTLIGDCEPALFLYEEELSDHVGKLKTTGSIPEKSDIEELTHFLTGDVEASDFRSGDPIEEEDMLMILYTAGTTGLPKGAIINHRMLFWNAVNTTLRLDLNSEDHTQSFAPFFHTGGWHVLFTPFLFNGASHTILSGFDAELILRLMEEEKTTLLFGVPTMLQMMADSPLFDEADLSSVRYAIVGGAPMPVPLIEKWHEKGVFIRQGYGLTEVGVNCFSLHQDDAVRKIGSIGFPNFYIDAKIVNEYGEDCGPNEVGELWMRSPVVTPGYWRKEKETEAAITDGWFHTGDMVREDEEGYHYVVDRKKNMYISGGENVYPAEVEKTLYSHQAVKEAAVIGVPDERWGEVGKAFVVGKEGENLTQDELKELCKERLAKYKIPVYIVFLKALPKNEAGKINRLELKNLQSE
jgi:fatty-acyl-CoA synthase